MYKSFLCIPAIIIYTNQMRCNLCREEKPDNEFDTNPKTGDYFKTCRECKTKRNNRIRNQLNRDVPEGHQMCNRKNGHIILLLEEFGWCEKTGNWHKMCPSCRKIVNEGRIGDEKDKSRQARWREKNKEYIKQKGKERYENKKEEIKEKARKYYNKNREKVLEYKSKFYQNNKDRLNAKHRIFYQNNKHKYKIWRENWKQRNLEKVKEDNKRWRKNNWARVLELNRESKKRCIEWHRIYWRNYRLLNPILVNTRSQISNVVRNNKKGSKYTEILGCSVDNLRQWLSYQLKSNYNLDSLPEGEKWHLDHFIPCHSFDLRNEENRQKCFNWKNLQWMPASDNIRKSNKMSSNKEINERMVLLKSFSNEV